MENEELAEHDMWLPGTPLKLRFDMLNFALAQQRDGIRVSIKNLAEPSLGDFLDLVAVGAAHYNLPLSEIQTHIQNVKGNKMALLAQMVDATGTAMGLDDSTINLEEEDEEGVEGSPEDPGDLGEA